MCGADFVVILDFSIIHFLLNFLHLCPYLSDVGILYLIQHEAHGKLLALLFKILRLVILSTPYVPLFQYYLFGPFSCTCNVKFFLVFLVFFHELRG